MKRVFLVSALTFLLLLAGITTAGASELDVSNEDVSAENATEHVNIRAPEGVASPFVNLQYTIIYWGGEWVVTIRGIIDPGLILPATVEIGVPTGTAVDWIGQVDAGFNDDPLAIPMSPLEVSPPYNIYTEGDTDIYTVVLSDSHAVQLEFPFVGNPSVPTEEDGAVQFSYTPLGDVDELWLATAIPANSAVLDPEIRELDGLGPSGELTFARTFYDAIGGQEYTALIEYRTGVTEVEQNLASWILPALIGGFAVIAAGVFILFRRGTKG